jgi:hypothetical protein
MQQSPYPPRLCEPSMVKSGPVKTRPVLLPLRCSVMVSAPTTQEVARAEWSARRLPTSATKVHLQPNCPFGSALSASDRASIGYQHRPCDENHLSLAAAAFADRAELAVP